MNHRRVTSTSNVSEILTKSNYLNCMWSLTSISGSEASTELKLLIDPLCSFRGHRRVVTDFPKAPHSPAGAAGNIAHRAFRGQLCGVS